MKMQTISLYKNNNDHHLIGRSKPENNKIKSICQRTNAKEPATDDLPLSHSSDIDISDIFVWVMSLCDAKKSTTSRFSFLIGTISKRHQNGVPANKYDKKRKEKETMRKKSETQPDNTQHPIALSRTYAIRTLLLDEF